jgi:hypothetical protein
MRRICLIAAMIGVASVIAPEAKAQYYPWCATYHRIGAENCGFVTFAQCRANVSGIGGFCYRNPWHYAVPAPGPVYRRPYRAKKHYR